MSALGSGTEAALIGAFVGATGATIAYLVHTARHPEETRAARRRRQLREMRRAEAERNAARRKGPPA